LPVAAEPLLYLVYLSNLGHHPEPARSHHVKKHYTCIHQCLPNTTHHCLNQKFKVLLLVESETFEEKYMPDMKIHMVSATTNCQI
jgi:hypothetical protein